MWSGSGQAEYECDQVSESVVTLGALINFHTTLMNVQPVNTGYDDSLVHSSSPGAGAFSYYSGHIFEATADIKAGSEIFGNYGVNWLDSREGTYADSIPRHNDFQEAFKLFKIMHRDFVKNSVPITDALIGSFADIVKHLNTRIGNAFPKTAKQFQELQRRQFEGLYPGAVLLGHVMQSNDRDSKWIKENGLCLENIRPGKSTIPDAGRGAFANGFIPKGSIVSPAPLLNIVDRSKLNVLHRKKNITQSEAEDLISQQLLINYCFSHVDSSLLLCPQTNAILINHCSKRMGYERDCEKNGPNAMIRWATNWDKDTEKWLQMSLDEIAQRTEEGTRGLSLEIIATRDILPNEEIFIDYGENWEHAWKEHTNSFNKDNTNQKDYPTIRSLINAKDFRTVHQQETNPYPDHIQTVCFYPDADRDDFDDNDDDEFEMVGSSYVSEDMDSEYTVFPCHILEKYNSSRARFKTSTMYSVRIFLGPDHDNETIVLTQYPEDSISMRVKKNKSAQHNPKAFRHFMEISDDLFPDHWKNIVGQKKNVHIYKL